MTLTSSEKKKILKLVAEICRTKPLEDFISRNNENSDFPVFVYYLDLDTRIFLTDFGFDIFYGTESVFHICRPGFIPKSLLWLISREWYFIKDFLDRRRNYAKLKQSSRIIDKLREKINQ